MPFSSTTTDAVFSLFAIASTPFQKRYFLVASTRRDPQNGPSSSRSVVAKAIGSRIVEASSTKPPSSSCWYDMQCDEIGYVMCASCTSSNSP